MRPLVAHCHLDQKRDDWYHVTMKMVRSKITTARTATTRTATGKIITGNRVGAAEFKARCLELMDQVAATGNAMVITKRGQPVARLVPVSPPRPKSLVGALRGHIRIKGDIVGPLGIEWEASR
jgi:prevent-host-death family protein